MDKKKKYLFQNSAGGFCLKDGTNMLFYFSKSVV